ncbi:hypothetical protein [Virgibacillus sp. DJP39]|uniref:hypothetical protein n=1 Tax=Virgibacillus sp. DJP39 TaxID=3409790 RepID=UPI003BB4ADEB
MDEKSEYRLFVEWLADKNQYGSEILKYFNLGYSKPNLAILEKILSEEELERLKFNFNQNVYECNQNASESQLKKMLII